MGSKGIGEVSMVGFAPALANAVNFFFMPQEKE
jgi:CO/xanthine dehydrogenase Mo-binding subunit